MGGFPDTYLGRLRAVVGDRLVLMPGARIVIQNCRGGIGSRSLESLLAERWATKHSRRQPGERKVIRRRRS
jgi:hypothetical protein